MKPYEVIPLEYFGHSSQWLSQFVGKVISSSWHIHNFVVSDIDHDLLLLRAIDEKGKELEFGTELLIYDDEMEVYF